MMFSGAESTPNAIEIKEYGQRLDWYTYVLAITGCFLALYGSLVIFLTYFRIPAIRKSYIRELLLYLTVANLLDVFAIFIGLIPYGWLRCQYDFNVNDYCGVCLFQTFWISFAPTAMFFWTIVIAIYFQVQIIDATKAVAMSTRSWTVIYHVICWGIPGSVTFAAYFAGVLGEDVTVFDGAWGWIRHDMGNCHKQMTWMLVTKKAWELLCFLITAEVLLYIIFRKIVLKKPYDDTFTHRGDKNFIHVWLILYLIRLPGAVRFILQYTYQEEHDPVLRNMTICATSAEADTAFLVLANLQALLDPSQAFFNCLFLCVADKTVRNHYNCCTTNTVKCEPGIPEELTGSVKLNENKPLLVKESSA